MIRTLALTLALCCAACELQPAPSSPPPAPHIVPQSFGYTPPTEAERAAELARVAQMRAAARRIAYRRAVAQRRADLRRAYAISLILN